MKALRSKAEESKTSRAKLKAVAYITYLNASRTDPIRARGMDIVPHPAGARIAVSVDYFCHCRSRSGVITYISFSPTDLAVHTDISARTAYLSKSRPLCSTVDPCTGKTGGTLNHTWGRECVATVKQLTREMLEYRSTTSNGIGTMLETEAEMETSSAPTVSLKAARTRILVPR